MKIAISDVKRWRESIGATHIVVFSVDSDGSQHVATHGKTAANAKEAADAGNNLKKALGWPVDMCNSRPMDRVCKNCVYYKPDRGIHCFNGWSGDGSRGHCMEKASECPAVSADRCCSQFEPKE